jgi:hypothetical protein
VTIANEVARALELAARHRLEVDERLHRCSSARRARGVAGIIQPWSNSVAAIASHIGTISSPEYSPMKSAPAAFGRRVGVEERWSAERFVFRPNESFMRART